MSQEKVFFSKIARKCQKVQKKVLRVPVGAQKKPIPFQKLVKRRNVKKITKGAKYASKSAKKCQQVSKKFQKVF